MNTMNINVKIICCDNAGENKALEENCANNSEEIKFEFTSPSTPQQNGMVEQIFSKLYSWVRTMMNHAGLL